MLLNLAIGNFAIIDRLDIEFGSGFNVLTGETGAGKSIILDAFGLLLGDRARPDLVRAGAAEATVEALFLLDADAPVRQLLRDAGLPGADADELILRRLVQGGGRSRAYVNGAMVTLAQLQPLAEQLVMVCGQHEHQSLLQRDAHLEMLDSFARNAQLRVAYRNDYLRRQELAKRLAELEELERDRQQQLDFLNHQSQELAAANLDPDEEDALQAERLLLQNGERLLQVSQAGYAALYGDQGAVCERLAELAGQLAELARIDPALAPLGDTLSRAQYDVEDVAAQLRHYSSRCQVEPGRLEQVEERLGQLARLKRKYAPTIAEILALKQKLDERLEQLDRAGATRDELTGQLDELDQAVRASGAALSRSRRAAGEGLSATVAAELADLAMTGARFAVQFDELAAPAETGLEKVEFLLAANPGEPLHGLARVVSGGELSRLMLALKRAAPGADRVPTLIFDEVDAGIGGETATSVGRKLRGVSRSAQVLCVTHLPQVAACADRHFQVCKGQIGGRTVTDVRPLDSEARIREMARMLAGAHVGEQTLLHARELIAASVGSP
ncbi:MAG: DNA repair protein RecN [Desulfuromonadales bacterium]|nr:DNA repair protein RecN [Desulfuromonadales bacterium]